MSCRRAAAPPTMMIRASSAQPICRPASARPFSVAKLRCIPHGLARAAWNPMASRSVVSASMAAALRRAEQVQHGIDDTDCVSPLDTTIHDGEQSPESIMASNDDKLLPAHQRVRIGVVTVKIYSPQDLDAVGSIAIEEANTPVVDGEDGHVQVICFLPWCNNQRAWEARNPHSHIILATSNILKLPFKPQQLVDIAKQAVSLDEMTINGSGETARNACFDGPLSAILAPFETGRLIVMDLNGMRKFKGTSETKSSGDVGSTHENGLLFLNGNLSGNHNVGTKVPELGYDKEFKDTCTYDKLDEEEKKPPMSLDSLLHTITKSLNLVQAVFGVCTVITRIGQQSPECLPLMWQMMQPCLRVTAFLGLGITLAAGFAAMCFGMVVVLKAKSTSHSA